MVSWKAGNAHVKEPPMVPATHRELRSWFIIIKCLIKDGSKMLTVDQFPNG